MRDEALNQYRRRRRQWERALVAVPPASSVDPEPSPDLLRAVAALSVRQRSVLFLAYWQDMTEADIADTLGLTRSTVHRTLVRSRLALRKVLS